MFLLTFSSKIIPVFLLRKFLEKVGEKIVRLEEQAQVQMYSPKLSQCILL